MTPLGPLHFEALAFSDDAHVVQGEILEREPSGVVRKVLARTAFRDGVEAPEAAARPPLQLLPGFGQDYAYRASPSGRFGVRASSPVTLVRYADGRTLTLLVTRLAGKAQIAVVDSSGNYAGDPELTQRLLYAQGSSARDAVLVHDANGEHHHPDLLQRFLDGQD